MLPVQERLVRRLAGQTEHDQEVSWRWDGRSFRFTVPGDNVWICVKDDLLLREYEWMGTRLQSATGVVVDAGAHVGTFSALAAVNAERVVALEPNPGTVDLLRRNLTENGLDNVEVHEGALWSDEDGRVLDDSGASSSASIAVEDAAGPRVPTTTIDAVVAETGPVDVFKMDIEGSEFAAVAAASDASLHQIGELVGELHLNDAAPGDVDRFVTRLEGAGFTVDVSRLPIFHVRDSLSRLRRHWSSLDGQVRLKLTLAAVYLAAGALDPVTGARTRLAGHDLRLFRAWRQPTSPGRAPGSEGGPAGGPSEAPPAPRSRRGPSRPRIGRVAARTIWQPDKWERLSLVADHVGGGPMSVLDVGGRGHEMARLLPEARVVSANVQAPADTIVPPDELPFDDDAFDVVTSCDVIEHMEADRRAGHVAELLRVARRRLVLCCPWGSTERVEEELRLWDRLESELGIRADFLDEHIEYGLPTETDLRGWILAAAPGASIVTRYQPAFEGGEDLVVDGLRARHRRDPAALLRYLRRGYLTRRRPELSSAPSSDSHRLFVIVELPA